MTGKVEPLADLTTRAIEILFRELGTADALRFVNQFTTGFGDYMANRDDRFGSMKLDEIVKQIKESASDRSSR